MVNIYVGNLSFSCTERELQELFAQHGQVQRASIVMDRETGRSRGFGFVEMPNDAEGEAAIQALNGAQFGGRALTVNAARPREAGGARAGVGGGGGGGGRGGFAGGGGRGYSGGRDGGGGGSGSGGHAAGGGGRGGERGRERGDKSRKDRDDDGW